MDFICDAKKMTDDATTLGDSSLGAYVSNNVNCSFNFFRPTMHDMVCAYVGPASMAQQAARWRLRVIRLGTPSAEH